MEGLIALSTNVVDVATKIVQMKKDIQTLQAKTGTDIST
jgi:hypothetical protein